jgi:hypothetical protein
MTLLTFRALLTLWTALGGPGAFLPARATPATAGRACLAALATVKVAHPHLDVGLQLKA